MDDLLNNSTLYFMAGMMAGCLAWGLSIAKPDNAQLLLFIGLLASSILLAKSANLLVSYGNHRLGLLGEQVVGQILDRFSSDSIRVFHDLEVLEPGKKAWNIDHIVVSQGGVFAIETKCRRKPRGRSMDGQQGHRLTFDGQQLIFPPPMKQDRFGIDQSQRNGTWLAEKLGALNGTSIHVTPVLVFPGWWVDAKGKGTVTVINHKQLPSLLCGRAKVLSDQQFRAICAQLEERCKIDLSRAA